ncbi:hypothetical protein B7463_g2384, partial [Scytalidium lignicola]
MNEETNGLTASSEIPDQHVFEGVRFDTSDDEDWEVVERENTISGHDHTASHLTLAFTWHYKFALQSAARSSESENNDCKMATQNNYAILIHEQHQCRLFSLPVELRLRIYEQVLSIESPSVQLKWYPANHRKNLRPSVLLILETCRRIYIEAEPIFYSINHFQYPVVTPRLATSFCKAINPNRRDAIRSLTIVASSGSKALCTIQELTLLSKLQKLRIERQQSIRYIEIESWVVLAKQMKMELENLSELRELEIVTPETITPTRVEEDRMRRLGQIDALLQEVTSKPSLASA